MKRKVPVPQPAARGMLRQARKLVMPLTALAVLAGSLPAAAGDLRYHRLAESNTASYFLEVKGKVIDQNGKPVVGASVSVVGEKKAVVTDIMGNFTITAGADVTLSFSHV